MELSRENIEQLLQGMRQRNSYHATLEKFLGRKLTDRELLNHNIYTRKQLVAQRKAAVGREARIRAIMLRRYNVPAKVLDAYDEEIMPHGMDW